ncbi:MAG TPA: CpsB/CapC family capsule biosynthesis tyrosine phosphatase [Gemmatimonadales bacterium]|jgi:protein-tyrosine phosphatase|nr:CpsB/CapC family capsule biosynthesis tyrosine phosphatase [Gemmatimonadales bacterium]
MIDLHGHLLPGVDDGSRNVQQSVRVLRTFAAKGITDVACTPHLLASKVEEGWPANYEAAWAALTAEVPEGITLHRGAEVMLDRPMPAGVAERKITLGGSRYVLVEFPRMVPAEIVARALAEVLRTGLVPILAHPERYSSCSVDTVRAWRELGAVIQVDATTMTLPRSRGDRARDIVVAGLADILGADNHGDERNVATALDWLSEHDGADQAILLLETNPRAILDDKTPYEVDPLPMRTPIWRSVRRLFGSE